MRQTFFPRFTALCCGLLLAGCAATPGAEPDTSAPESPVTTVEGDLFPTEKLMRSIELRPVLQLGKLDNPTEEDLADTDPQDDVFIDDKGYAHLLGPSLASGYLVFTASASAKDDGTFAVIVALSSDPADLAAVEAAMKPCIAKTEICPEGQLAFLADGAFVTAPVVSQPPAYGTLEIGGLDSYEEARQIAERLAP
jgi:hypothetical protein